MWEDWDAMGLDHAMMPPAGACAAFGGGATFLGHFN
jgi:hypothetical protein